MSKILIVDDDNEIRNLLRIYLQNDGHTVIESSNGEEAVEMVNDDIDLILLDVMMPKLDGIATCSKIRENYFMPILFLTAKTEDMDKIAGLTIGADDYITKPFNAIELLARVKSNLRRTSFYNTQQKNITVNNTIFLDDLEIDISAHIVKKSGNEVYLTKTEFGILELLVTNKGRIFNLEQIYAHVWGEESILNAESTVSVHIKKLREKIEDNKKKPQYIKTVWGVGYRVD